MKYTTYILMAALGAEASELHGKEHPPEQHVSVRSAAGYAHESADEDSGVQRIYPQFPKDLGDWRVTLLPPHRPTSVVCWRW
jgi:hypothetical protein